MRELPAPLTHADCDCTDLDGFYLNCERLMSSELVALSSREVIGCAVLLWCRAWKQIPAASLPDDDRVNAAFCGIPIKQFKKMKGEIMRGFVKCSDGRFYHKTLSEIAEVAFQKKQSFRDRRERDAKRLRDWRSKRDGNGEETHCETRFVQEGMEGEGKGKGRSSPYSPEGDQLGVSGLAVIAGGRP